MDFNKIMQDELKTRRADNMFQGYQSPEQPPQKADAHVSIDDEEIDLNEVYGPTQVRSLLGLVVDSPLHKRIEDANDDVLAIHQLNELNSHRRG
jgi:hypothetical protein